MIKSPPWWTFHTDIPQGNYSTSVEMFISGSAELNPRFREMGDTDIAGVDPPDTHYKMLCWLGPLFHTLLNPLLVLRPIFPN